MTTTGRAGLEDATLAASDSPDGGVRRK